MDGAPTPSAPFPPQGATVVAGVPAPALSLPDPVAALPLVRRGGGRRECLLGHRRSAHAAGDVASRGGAGRLARSAATLAGWDLVPARVAIRRPCRGTTVCAEASTGPGGPLVSREEAWGHTPTRPREAAASWSMGLVGSLRMMHRPRGFPGASGKWDTPDALSFVHNALRGLSANARILLAHPRSAENGATPLPSLQAQEPEASAAATAAVSRGQRLTNSRRR